MNRTADSSNDSNSPQDKKTSGRGRYVHLVVLTAIYTLIACVTFLLIDYTMGESATYGFPFVVSLVLLAASWSVMGPGNYIKRFLFIHLLVLASVLCGATAALSSIPIDFVNWKFYVLVSIVLAPVFTIAAQVPLWFFRGLFGWRIAQEDDQVEATLTLKEIFIITLVFGIALTAPRIAQKLIVAESIRELQIGAETYASVSEEEYESGPSNAMMTSGTGATRYYALTKITPENIESIKAQTRSDVTSGLFYGVSAYAGVVAVLALLSAYYIWACFGLLNTRTSAIWILGSFFALYLLIALFFIFTTDFRFFFNQISLQLAIYLGLSINSICIPMLASRARGFRLRTNRTERNRRSKKKANQSPAIQSAASRPALSLGSEAGPAAHPLD